MNSVNIFAWMPITWFPSKCNSAAFWLRRPASVAKPRSAHSTSRIVRTPGRAERCQRHQNRRSRLKPAPLDVVRVRISHLTESFKNVGAASGQGVIIRTFSKRQFATRAQRPFTACPEATPELGLERRAQPAVGVEPKACSGRDEAKSDR